MARLGHQKRLRHGVTVSRKANNIRVLHIFFIDFRHGLVTAGTILARRSSLTACYRFTICRARTGSFTHDDQYQQNTVGRRLSPSTVWRDA